VDVPLRSRGVVGDEVEGLWSGNGARGDVGGDEECAEAERARQARIPPAKRKRHSTRRQQKSQPPV
jgi:hypothetical protein